MLVSGQVLRPLGKNADLTIPEGQQDPTSSTGE